MLLWEQILLFKKRPLLRLEAKMKIRVASPESVPSHPNQETDSKYARITNETQPHLAFLGCLQFEMVKHIPEL